MTAYTPFRPVLVFADWVAGRQPDRIERGWHR